MDNFYYSFNQYLKKRFGERVHRLSLDAGFGCPNIDGTLSKKGCIFCNNRAFSYFTPLEKASDFYPVRDGLPSAAVRYQWCFISNGVDRRLLLSNGVKGQSSLTGFANRNNVALEEQIVSSMDYARRRFKAKKFIAYFQGFTSTYGDKEFLSRQYNTIRKFDNIVGLAISTRPDCIDQEKLDIIESFTGKYEVYIEYGLQSVHDKTLKTINRNHSFLDFKKAVDMTHRRKNIHICAHIILGLPGESKDEMLETARVISAMPLWGVKFHCLHVVKDTTLQEMYNSGKVKLLSEDEYIDILINFLEIIPPDYVILRLVSDANKALLIAPKWMNEKQRILKKMENEFKQRETYQGRLYESAYCKS